MKHRPLIVVALGGNAILKKGQKGTVEEQWGNVRRAASLLADLVGMGYRLVVTHGNGPQVGNLLVMMEAVKDRIPPLTMDIAGAMTQGWIGYMIQQALINELRMRNIWLPVVTIVTQVLVDRDDPSFSNPTKYVGPYYTEEEARRLEAEKGWVMRRDPRGGWRRVVPSPEPLGIVERNAIRHLVGEGYIVIASGGGGIPVVMEDGRFRGVEAVIDKDLAAQLLANSLGADTLLILTDVPGVAINYGRPGERWLRRVSLDEVEQYYREGHFPPGSMGPKILASIRFLRGGGRRAIICALEDTVECVKGRRGTEITVSTGNRGNHVKKLG